MRKDDMFSDPHISDGLKSFAVSLIRLSIQDPRILLLLDKVDKNVEKTDIWKLLYDDFQNPESQEKLTKVLAKIVDDHDWDNIEKSYDSWGRFGWVVNHHLYPIGFWDDCPKSQIEADKKVLKTINKKVLSEIKLECLEKTRNIPVFEECCKCFDNRCYCACASLLISLIDGELIRSKANYLLSNRKTGATAGKRIITDVSADDMYGLPGLFHLEILNYEAYISTLFESANGFSVEPERINRNFIHHGMSNRKVLRKDCIKLFLAYHKTLFLLWNRATGRR